MWSVIKGELLEMWITFDNEMPNLPLTLDSLTQGKKKDQAILFCPIKHGKALILFINGFYVILRVRSVRLTEQIEYVLICNADNVSYGAGI